MLKRMDNKNWYQHLLKKHNPLLQYLAYLLQDTTMAQEKCERQDLVSALQLQNMKLKWCDSSYWHGKY